MPRRPVDVHIPHDARAAARSIAQHLRRLYREASDYREPIWPIGALSHGQEFKIAGATVFTTPRDRRWLALQLSFFCVFDNGGSVGSGATNQLAVTATLYAGSEISANRIFTVSAGSAGTGWKRATTTTVLNAGKENQLAQLDTWGLVINATGGSGNAAEHITVGVVYEDFVTNLDRATG